MQNNNLRELSSIELRTITGGSMKWVSKKIREIRHTIEDVAMIGVTVVTGIVIGTEALNKYGPNTSKK